MLLNMLKKYCDFLGMKKKYKIILLLCIIWLSFFLVDFTLSRYDRKPIFAVPVKVYKDGGSVEYCGLGYKVIKYNVLDNKETGKDGRKDTEFGFWNLEYKE